LSKRAGRGRKHEQRQKKGLKIPVFIRLSEDQNKSFQRTVSKSRKKDLARKFPDGDDGDPIVSLPGGLTENTVEAARRIKFEPARKRDEAVTAVKILSYGFTVY
jgi:hypothetical protein